MHTITLICSVHSVKGNCNVEQLVKILQAIGPDVVFQEVRPSHDWSLEAQAVTAYGKFKLCRQVHVDEYKAPANAAETESLLSSGFEYVGEESEEYRLLESRNNEHTSRDGFNYLNSAEFERTRERMSEIEDRIMGGKAGCALRWWRQVTHGREIEMMRNIYAHCRANPFDIGVFLVGAGHKTSIAKQIKSLTGRELGLIVWNLYDGQLP